MRLAAIPLVAALAMGAVAGQIAIHWAGAKRPLLAPARGTWREVAAHAPSAGRGASSPPRVNAHQDFAPGVGASRTGGGGQAAPLDAPFPGAPTSSAPVMPLRTPAREAPASPPDPPPPGLWLSRWRTAMSARGATPDARVASAERVVVPFTGPPTARVRPPADALARTGERLRIAASVGASPWHSEQFQYVGFRPRADSRWGPDGLPREFLGRDRHSPASPEQSLESWIDATGTKPSAAVRDRAAAILRDFERARWQAVARILDRLVVVAATGAVRRARDVEALAVVAHRVVVLRVGDVPGLPEAIEGVERVWPDALDAWWARLSSGGR